MNCLVSVLFVVLLSTSCGRSIFAAKEALLERGNEHFREGRYEDAVLQYRKALQKDSRYGEAAYRLALAYLKLGKGAEAYQSLVQAAELLPDRTDIKVELADLALRSYLANPRSAASGFYEVVERISRQLLDSDPASFDGLRLKAHLVLLDGRPAEAARLFEQAHSIKPERGDVVTGLVDSLILAGNPEQAEKTAWDFLATNQGDPALFDALHRHYVKNRRLADADKVLLTKVERYPKVTFYRLQLAEHYLRTNRRAEAIDVIHALRRDPGAARTLLEVGDFCREMGEHDQALETYRAGITANPKDELIYQKRIAELLLERGKDKETAALLDSLIQRHPDDSDLRAARAALRLSARTASEIERGISEFQSLVEKEPKRVELRYKLAKAYRRAGREAEAREQLELALKTEPQHVPSMRELADILLRSGDSTGALRLAESILKQAPGDPAARLVRTAAWALQGRYNEIRAELASLRKEYPGLREVELQTAMLHLAEKRYAEAESILKRNYLIDYDLRFLRGLAQLYLAQKQPQKALAFVRAQQPRMEGREEYQYLLARTAVDAGEYAVASTVYLDLLRNAPDSAFLLLELGRLELLQLRREAAVEYFRKAEKVIPKNSRMLAEVASAYADAGSMQDAIRTARQSLALEPENIGLMNNLAYWIAEAGGDLEEAEKLTRQALRKAPDHPAILDTVAWIHLKRGSHSSALPIFERLVKNEPANSAFRVHLAAALKANGRPQEAQEELRAALRLNPHPLVRRQIEETLNSTRH